MSHRLKSHLKKQGSKFLAATLVMTLFTVAIQYRPSAFETAQAAAQEDWATPTLVNTVDGEWQKNQQSVRTSDGKYIVAHVQSDSGYNPTTLRINKLNADGTKAWTEQTFSDLGYISNILLAADNSGGAFLGLETYQSGNYNVNLKRIDSDGNLLCSTTNIYVSSSSSQRLNGLAYDGNNGVYFHWMEYTGYDGYITHLIDNGTATCVVDTSWNTGGVGTYRYVRMQDSGGNADLNSTNTTSKLITDSNYDIVVAAQERSNYNLYVNKFDGVTGAIYTGWPSYIYLTSYNTGGFDIVSDESGGTHVIYNAADDGSGNRIVKNVHILSNGSTDPTMTKNIFQDTSAGGDIYPGYVKATYDNNTGSVIASWEDNYYIAPNTYVLSAQKIDSSGNLWDISSPPANPIQVADSTYDARIQSIASDDQGGAFISYLANEGGTYRHYINYLKTGGTPDFGTYGYEPNAEGGPAGSSSSKIQVIPNGTNGIIAVWEEKVPSDSEGDIFAMSLSSATPLDPTFTSIAPTGGSVGGGTLVTITGDNFVNGDTTVTLGGVACTGVSVSDAQHLTCTTGAHTAGSVSLALQNTGSLITLVGNAYEYFAPTLTSIDPNYGFTAGGDSVTVTGDYFVDGVTSISLGGVACTGVSVTDAQHLTCTTGAHAEGSVSGNVTIGTDGTIVSNFYTYTDGNFPGFTSISPNEGATAGGTLVTITGDYFVAGNTTVTLGGSSCTGVTVTDAQHLTCTTTSHTMGAVQLNITTPGGTTAVQSAYTYQPPQVDSIIPSSGPIDGGTLITITGDYFIDGDTTVTIGGVACTGLTVISPQSLTCTTDAHAAGSVTVIVSITEGNTAISNGFTYSSGCDGTSAYNEQCGDITVGCPAYTGSDLVFQSVPADVIFTGVVAGVDTDTADSSATDSTNLPGGNSSGNTVTGTPISNDHLLRITDTTSKGIDNCGTNGWQVTASVTSDISYGSGKGLANTSTGQSGQYHSIDAQNIYLVTTANVDFTNISAPEIPQLQTGPVYYSRYNASSLGNPDNLTSSYSTTNNVWSNVADYSTNGTSMESAATILSTGCNATLKNGHNADIYTGVGLAIDNGIDALQASGIYQGTITYTLSELVC